jgi:hypothetical protein
VVTVQWAFLSLLTNTYDILRIKKVLPVLYLYFKHLCQNVNTFLCLYVNFRSTLVCPNLKGWSVGSHNGNICSRVRENCETIKERWKLLLMFIGFRGSNGCFTLNCRLLQYRFLDVV